MAERKHPRLSRRRESPRKRLAALFLTGSLLILWGVWLSWDDSSALDMPDWVVSGPIIDIAAEVHGGNLSVRCDLEENGIFTLQLQGGKYFKKAAQVWIFVEDLFLPFRWEIAGGEVTSRLLSFQTAEGNGEADGYPNERKYVSIDTGFTAGESAGLLDIGCYTACFAAVIQPGEKGGCTLRFQMEPKHTEYRAGNTIIVRMPWITNSRKAPVYEMTSEDFKELVDAGQYDMLPQFSNFMIDGVPIFETRPTITGEYFSEYTTGPDIVINSVQPELYQVLPSISWRESSQWTPYLSFRDLGSDRSQFFCTWLSGLLVAVGSGLVVLPLSHWLSSEEKYEDARETPRNKPKR